MEQKDLIEKFIQNRLSSKEKLTFDELLKNDVDFKNEVAFHTNLKKAVKNNDNESFKNLISDLELKVKRPGQKYSYSKWLVAASIILLLGLTYFLTIFNKPSTNDLFASYFQPYENVISPIERSSDQQGEKALAFYTYEEGDYEVAIILFSKLYKSTKEPYYLFYKANALLTLERANEAVPLLLEHLKTEDALTEKTKWYLALAYLKKQENQNAKKLLKEVIKDGNYKTKDAEKLLKEID